MVLIVSNSICFLADIFNISGLVVNDQPYGKQATRNLNKLIGGRVFVVEKDIDRYGRLVGTIYTPEGVNVNEAMVCNGSAWWYSRYARFASGLRKCQAEGKKAALGLWADDDPMPPWEWRRLQ